MSRKIVRLERDTIVEATFEVRFQGTNKTLADLLPGILFAKFKDRFPQTLRTPTSNIPREMQDAAPDLRYLARHVLANKEFQISIGDYAVQISNRRPYVGWARYKPLIIEILGYLHESALIAEVERFSLKYTNLIEGEGLEKQYSHIKLNGTLGHHDLLSRLTLVRTEIHQDGLINIVEIAPTTKVRMPESKDEIEGVMVAVDTIDPKPVDFWGQKDALLDRAHDMEKSIFFDIVTEETLAGLGPVYG